MDTAFFLGLAEVMGFEPEGPPFSWVVQHLSENLFLSASFHQHSPHEFGFCDGRQLDLCVVVFVVNLVTKGEILSTLQWHMLVITIKCHCKNKVAW